MDTPLEPSMPGMQLKQLLNYSSLGRGETPISSGFLTQNGGNEDPSVCVQNMPILTDRQFK